jgi:hypothetical protein
MAHLSNIERLQLAQGPADGPIIRDDGLGSLAVGQRVARLKQWVRQLDLTGAMQVQ